MNPQAYALLGLTALIAVVVAVVAFAVLRLAGAARDTRRALRDRAGDSPLLASALQDAIQKLRQQERATAERAQASERLNTLIVNSLSAGLLVVDRDGRVQIFNPAGRRMLGISEESRFEHYTALPPRAAPLAAVVGECLATGGSVMRRALEMPGGGKATHVGVTASSLPQAEGSSGGVVCLFSDLTAVIQLEEQLRLKETLARLGELTAGIAHEFRNGLATIHGYGKLLDPAQLPPQFAPYVEGIRQEAEALGEVVTNFLNFARPAQLSLAPHDLRAIIDRATDDLRSEAGLLGGEIAIAGQFGRVEADDVLLRQAWINLCRNAVEACQAAGVVPRIHVEGQVDVEQGVVHVRVSDNGPGVAEEARDKVFRPFFTTKKTGTGLGLALVQKIVVTHNGRVSVTNAPAGGACFHVTLPIA
jgi:PAS domain S-box-containing protein